VPVIWERPAQFSRELANKLMVAGDLKNVLVLITRNGKAGDMQTTYSVDVLPETHPVFKPEMIPADFSAFNNFNIAKHSYWEKTVEEINTFLATGQFPEVARANNQQTVNNVANTANAYTAPTTPAYTAPVQTVPAAPQFAPNPTPNFEAYSAPQQPVNTAVPNTATATEPAQTPVRNFSGFSF
jgi:hypothetical protein